MMKKFGAMILVILLSLQTVSANPSLISPWSIAYHAADIGYNEQVVKKNNEKDTMTHIYSGDEFNQPHYISIDGNDLIIGWEANPEGLSDGRVNKASHQTKATMMNGWKQDLKFNTCMDDESFPDFNNPSLDAGSAPGLMHASSPMQSSEYPLQNRIYGGYYHAQSGIGSTYGCVIEGWTEYISEGSGIVNQIYRRNISANPECTSQDNQQETNYDYEVSVIDCFSQQYILIFQNLNENTPHPSIGFLSGCVASDFDNDYLFGGLTVDGTFRHELIIVNRTTDNITSHLLDPSIFVQGHSCVVNDGELFSFGGFSNCPLPPIPKMLGVSAWWENIETKPLGQCLGWIDENYASQTGNKLWIDDDYKDEDEYYQFPKEGFDCADNYRIDLTTFELLSASRDESFNCLAFRTGYIDNGTPILFGGIDQLGQTSKNIDIIQLESLNVSRNFEMYYNRIHPLIQIYDNGSISVTGGNSDTQRSGVLYRSVEWLTENGRTIIKYESKEKSDDDWLPWLPAQYIMGAIFFALWYKNKIHDEQISKNNLRKH